MKGPQSAKWSLMLAETWTTRKSCPITTMKPHDWISARSPLGLPVPTTVSIADSGRVAISALLSAENALENRVDVLEMIIQVEARFERSRVDMGGDLWVRFEQVEQ